LLNPTGAGEFRDAVTRLRDNGLTGAEAATEMLRRSFYDFIDSESEPDSSKVQRLRIIKR
jgi:hypothetical protein